MSRRSIMQSQMFRQPRYDLIVIGGGITGCGVAYEAAVRGASVLVLDQGDFAVGTSSRSTKLIHGGIRYLKQFDFRLVREGVRERQSLIDTIPHLVHPIQFVYPIHSGDPDPLWALRAGLILYDWFAGRKNLLPHKIHAGRTLLEVEPLLRADGLKGGALYVDCLTDDARLTVEVAKAAQGAGAVLVNYMAVRRFLYGDDGRMVGVEAVDRLGDDQPILLHAGAVLNATGPWVDMVRRLDDPQARSVLRPTKGVHIAVEHARLPVRHPVVMHAADKRLMFAVPRDGFTYLGTTDTDFTGDPAAVTIDRSDVSYILTATNRTFPEAGLTENHVVSAWAGIRSLAAASENAGPSQVSRDYKLHTSQSGLVSVAGGKLTAFVAMSRAIVGKVLPLLPKAEVPLRLASAADLPDESEIRSLAEENGLRVTEVQELIARHGSQVHSILAMIDRDIPGSRLRMLAAEASFGAAHEFAATLGDVLNRRTSQLLFSQDNGTAGMKVIAAAMGRVLGWDQAEEEAQVRAYEQEVAEMMAWRN